MVPALAIELALDHKPSHREMTSRLISVLYLKVLPSWNETFFQEKDKLFYHWYNFLGDKPEGYWSSFWLPSAPGFHQHNSVPEKFQWKLDNFYLICGSNITAPFAAKWPDLGHPRGPHSHWQLHGQVSPPFPCLNCGPWFPSVFLLFCKHYVAQTLRNNELHRCIADDCIPPKFLHSYKGHVKVILFTI